MRKSYFVSTADFSFGTVDSSDSGKDFGFAEILT
jgi:hypothetical protein